MHYTKVNVTSFGYELASQVVTSDDLEKRLAPVYTALHLQPGQLQALTGIAERRYWDSHVKLSDSAVSAGRKALAAAQMPVEQIDMLIYGGVCRENLEPATACAVAHGLGLGPQTQVYDVSNACLGVLNGIVQVANAIELGHARAGLVVSCESARQIVDLTIERLLAAPDMGVMKETLATLTGGSGAVAVLVTNAMLHQGGHRLLGGVTRNATQHYGLCTWGPDTGIPASRPHIMRTDSVGVLRHGVSLGIASFAALRQTLGWAADKPDKVICHQVGSTHQRTILEAIGIDPAKDFSTFRYLGNIGTVSLPITAAIAAERGFLTSGDLVGFLGIGSGLNCLMLGLQW